MHQAAKRGIRAYGLSITIYIMRAVHAVCLGYMYGMDFFPDIVPIVIHS